MPHSHQIFNEFECVFMSFFADVTEKDLIDSYNCLIADPSYNPSYKHLADFSYANSIEVRSEFVRRLAKKARLAPGTKKAIVVGNDLFFGLSRMYMAQHPRQSEVELFRDYKEACRWLGLPIDDKLFMEIEEDFLVKD